MIQYLFNESGGHEKNIKKGAGRAASLGKAFRKWFQSGRETFGQYFDAQPGDNFRDSVTNCQIITDCMIRLDEYEAAYELDKDFGRTPQTQSIFEILRETGKYNACTSHNSCNLVEDYYDKGLHPPPIWPPKLEK